MSLKETLLRFTGDKHFLEHPTKAQVFSHKAREKFIHNDNIILTLTGKTYKELMKITPDLFSVTESRLFDFIDLEIFTIPSSMTEVAFDPNKFILKSSDQKTFEEQLDFMKKNKNTYSHCTPTILSFPDYLEVLTQYYQLTGKHLLQTGARLRTISLFSDPQNWTLTINKKCIVSDFYWNSIPLKSLFIAPVLVPKK